MRREDGTMGDVAGGTAVSANLLQEPRALLAELCEGRFAAAEIDARANLASRSSGASRARTSTSWSGSTRSTP
jgi:hypothetical protein